MKTPLFPFLFESFLEHLYFIFNQILFLNNFCTAQNHSTALHFFPSVTLLQNRSVDYSTKILVVKGTTWTNSPGLLAKAVILFKM